MAPVEMWKCVLSPGPPESMREHVVAASNAMREGNWKACKDYILAIKVGVGWEWGACVHMCVICVCRDNNMCDCMVECVCVHACTHLANTCAYIQCVGMYERCVENSVYKMSI